MSGSQPVELELQYQVVYCSGEDGRDSVGGDSDPELLNGKEWISTKYCHYPQELVLKFKRKANLEKIQILCHSVYIPQKVEILVGNPGPGERVSQSKAKFERLGFVSFQNNTDEGTRELKSVYVDASGWFLKLLIHNNYKNSGQNPFDQVGIMEVVPTGYYLPDRDRHSESSDDERAARARPNRSTTAKSRKSRAPSGRRTGSGRRGSTSEKNYADEMRQIVKVLERKKKEAVAGEKFELAKQLKTAMDKIKAAQDEVDKLERDKREAAEEEDFDRAQDCKDSILALRTSLYADANLLKLLTPDERRLLGLVDPDRPRPPPESRPKPTYEDGPNPLPRTPPSALPVYATPLLPLQPQPYDSHQLPSVQPPSPSPEPRPFPTIEPEPPSPRAKSGRPLCSVSRKKNFSAINRHRESPSLIRRHRTPSPPPPRSPSPSDASPTPPPARGPGGNAYERKENTVLPAITKRAGRAESGGTGGSGSPEQADHLPRISGNNAEDEEDESAILQSLPERDRTAISQAINVFGIALVRDVYSKKWEKRKAGLEALQRKLEGTKKESKDQASYLLQPTLQILRKGLRDKVFAVFSTALDVLTYIVGVFIPQHKLGKSGGNTVADKTHYVLITRTGDTAGDSRFRQTSINYLLQTIATTEPPVARAYVTHIMRPFEATGYTKIDQGHSEIAERIVEDNSAPNEKLQLDEHKVCAFALSCIAHTDPDVRQTGARMVMLMYKNGDKDTVRQYLPPPTSKQALRNPLFKAMFDEMDTLDGKEPRSQAGKGSAATDDEEANLRALRAQNKELKQQLTRSKSDQSKSANSKAPRNDAAKKSYGGSSSTSKYRR